MPAFSTVITALLIELLRRIYSVYPRLARAGTATHSILAIALCTGVLATPTSASAAETLTVDGRQASAALNFTIIIPAVLRILENSHPSSLPMADMPASRVSAMQRMVLVSTLGKGFCMNLRLTQLEVADWQLRVSGSAGTWIEPSDGGYRLCARRAGRYELALQHDFSLKEKDGNRASPAAALDWPVNVSLATP